MAKICCGKCGSPAEASCECGVAYVPAKEFAARAIAENPDMSNRALGEMTGVSYNTIRNIRKSTDNNLSVDKRIGLDGRARKSPKPRGNPNIAPEQEAAIGQAVLNDGMTYEQAAEAFDLPSVQPVKIAVAREDGFAKGYEQGKHDAEINPSLLPLTAQQKLDVAIKQHKRKLDLEFDQAVQVEVQLYAEQTLLPHYQEKEEQADRVIKSRKGIMSRKIFRFILSWLHPDRVTDPGAKEQITQAFNAFRVLELLLCGEDELPTSASSMPRNFAEMQKAREVAKARRKSQSNGMQVHH